MIIELDSQKIPQEIEVVYRIRSGDVWRVNLDKENGPFPEKHNRIGKTRPCIVLSCEEWNNSSGSNRVLILPLSTKEPDEDMLIKTNLGITITSPRGGHLVEGYPCFNCIQTAHISSFMEYRGQVNKTKWEEITSLFSSEILKYKTEKLLKRIEDLEAEIQKLSDNRTTVILKDEFVSKLEEKIEELKKDNESKVQTILNLRETIENLTKTPDVELREPDKTVYSIGPKDDDTGFNSVISSEMYHKLSKSIAGKSDETKDSHKKVISYNTGNKRISKETVVSDKTQSKLNTPNNRVYTSSKSCYKQSTYIPNSKETIKHANHQTINVTDKEPTVALEIKIIEREEPEVKVVDNEESPKRKYDGLNTRSIKNWTPQQAKDFIEYVEEPHTILETCKKFNIKAYSTYAKLLPIITRLSRQK